MTHPLTDEIISENFTPDYDYFEGLGGEICLGFNNDDLRDATDWQLKQVLNWCSKHIHTESVDALRAAMRPQEDKQP